MGKDANKPRGKTTAYAFFVQQCREELKKKNPNETVVFSEFAKKCGEKWKAMSAKDKKRFEDMAEKDKARFDKEMATYVPTEGSGKKGKKNKKDPNAPKRALSAFFCFCNEERAKVKAKNPGLSVGEIAKELGKRWEVCPNKSKFEEIAGKDKQRYEREMAAYKKSGAAPSGPAKKAPAAKAPAAKAAPKKKQEEEDDDDDDEEEDDEDDDDYDDDDE